MEGGPPSFPQDFTCLVVLRIPTHCERVVLDGTLTRSGHAFQRIGVTAHMCHGRSYNPSVTLLRPWFGLFPVRSPLLRESRLISSRRATEMFQFTRCPPSLSCFKRGGLQTSLWRGCPIRNLRVLSLHAAPPERFAGLRVLLRPQAPRHPPRTQFCLFLPRDLVFRDNDYPLLQLC